MEFMNAYLDEAYLTVNVAAQVDDYWWVWARVVPPEYVIGELRVLPLYEEDVAGSPTTIWPSKDEQQAGYSTFRIDRLSVGLPARRLRDISPPQLIAWAREYADETGEVFKAMGGVAADRWRTVVREKRGDTTLSTAHRLALLASEYVDLVDGGELHPNKVLAESHGRSAGWVATEIHRARSREFGLLTRPDHGVRGKAMSGSSLTKKAQQLLEELEGTEDA